MLGILSPLAALIRRQPLLHRLAHRAVRLIPDPKCTVRMRKLGRVRIRLRRHRWFLWSSLVQDEAATLAMLGRLIRPGDVVYEVGANIGLHTRILCDWFRAGQVIAFEPMSDNFELLLANIALGGIGDRVRAFPIALSDVQGRQELQIDDMTSGTAVLSSVSGGLASVGRREFGLPPLSEPVDVITLDRLMQMENLPPPAVLKIDTEGAEAKVLRGARQTLQQHRPRLIIALHYADKTIQTLNLLDELGYASFGYVADPDRWAKQIYRQVHADDADKLADNNIVCSCDLNDVKDQVVPEQSTSPQTVSSIIDNGIPSQLNAYDDLSAGVAELADAPDSKSGSP